MHVKNLPTLVESYKTYDDVHIVKSNDIGQVGLVMVIVMVMLFGPRVSLKRKVVSKFLLRLERVCGIAGASSRYHGGKRHTG